MDDVRLFHSGSAYDFVTTLGSRERWPRSGMTIHFDSKRTALPRSSRGSMAVTVSTVDIDGDNECSEGEG